MKREFVEIRVPRKTAKLIADVVAGRDDAATNAHTEALTLVEDLISRQYELYEAFNYNPASKGPTLTRFTVRVQDPNGHWVLASGRGLLKGKKMPLWFAKKEASRWHRAGFYAAVFDGGKKKWEAPK